MQCAASAYGVLVFDINIINVNNLMVNIQLQGCYRPVFSILFHVLFCCVSPDFIFKIQVLFLSQLIDITLILLLTQYEWYYPIVEGDSNL